MKSTDHPQQQNPIDKFLAMQLRHHDSQAQKHGVKLQRQLSHYADELAASVVCTALRKARIEDSVLANRAEHLFRRLTSFDALVKTCGWTFTLILEGLDIKRQCDALLVDLIEAGHAMNSGESNADPQ